MKTTINKSNLMKRAWSIFRGESHYSYSFSASLRRAWEIEKANLAHKLEKESSIVVMVNSTPREANEHYMAGCTEWYANAHRGQYFGD